MKRNTGKPTEQAWETYWRQTYGKRACIIKFEDQADLVGLNRGRVVKSQAKPCDRILVLDGETCFCEIKSSHDKTAFRFSQFEEGQVRYATKIRAANGVFLVYVHRVLTNDWFRVPWSAIEETMDAGRKSLKWADLEGFRRDEFKDFYR